MDVPGTPSITKIFLQWLSTFIRSSLLWNSTRRFYLNIGLVSKPDLKILIPWWCHQMETFSALLALCMGIHWAPVNSPHKGQWRGALIFSWICVWINGWVNNHEAGDLKRRRAHYDVTVMPRTIACLLSFDHNAPPTIFLLSLYNDTIKDHVARCLNIYQVPPLCY